MFKWIWYLFLLLDKQMALFGFLLFFFELLILIFQILGSALILSTKRKTGWLNIELTH